MSESIKFGHPVTGEKPSIQTPVVAILLSIYILSSYPIQIYINACMVLIILTFLLVHFSGDIPKKRMKLAFIALLVSPASPFLLGNTIRQGLASVFLVGVIGHMIQSKKIKLLIIIKLAIL